MSLVDLDITGVAQQGVFVGRAEGQVVFVPDTDIGERVRVRIVERHKHFLRGVVVEVLQGSPFRRAHIWPEADVSRAPEQRVGGADYGHLQLAHQRDLKLEVLRDSLRRTGRFDSAEVDALHPEVQAMSGDDDRNGLGWRTRELLHVDADGVVGPFAARSHDVIAVDSLPLVSADLQQLDIQHRQYKGHRSVQLVRDDDGYPRVVVDGAVRGERTVVRTVGERSYHVDVRGFWQVHDGAAQLLCDVIAGGIAADRISPESPCLDLYGGVGLFAGWLGAAGLSVTSIESDARASELAVTNLADLDRVDVRNEPTGVFTGREAAQAPEQMYARSLVVLDPPRSGAGARVIADLVKLHPAQLLYVACDPVSLARDARQLVDAGYTMSSVQAYDLFPHSHHFETVASFLA